MIVGLVQNIRFIGPNDDTPHNFIQVIYKKRIIKIKVVWAVKLTVSIGKML